MSRVFITGGGGFLATHLAKDLLRRGHEVTLLVRGDGLRAVPPGASARRGDLLETEGELVPPATDIVFHLAAKSSVPESVADPRPTFEVNAMGTARLIDEVRTRSLNLRRFVLASTGQVYGPPFARPLDEEHPTVPRNPYSASKLAAESYALAADRLFDIPVAVLRIFNVFGPGQRGTYVVPSVLSQCIWSDELRIGNPWPVRDFVFVEDAIALFRLASTRSAARGEVLNVGSGRGTRIEAMVRMALHATGRDLKPRVEKRRQRRNDFDKLVADTSKARRLLGWRPRTDLEEGLRRTAEWMRARGPEAKLG